MAEEAKVEEKVEEKKQPTPYEIACYNYNVVLSRYLSAMSRVGDIMKYKKTFESNESWGPDREIYEWFRSDAAKALREIHNDMKKMREALVMLKKRREKLAKEEESTNE